jgi:hypothetical protein
MRGASADGPRAPATQPYRFMISPDIWAIGFRQSTLKFDLFVSIVNLQGKFGCPILPDLWILLLNSRNQSMLEKLMIHLESTVLVDFEMLVP